MSSLETFLKINISLITKKIIGEDLLFQITTGGIKTCLYPVFYDWNSIIELYNMTDYSTLTFGHLNFAVLTKKLKF